MNKMKIEIWSDIACPFCYIGKRKLELALDKFPHKDEIEIIWHSYELAPDMPRKSTIDESLINDKMSANAQMLTYKALEVGIEFNLNKVVPTNTSDALRLVKLAKAINKADNAEELLFKAYFTDGKSVSDRSTLLDIASKLGLKESLVVSMLDSDDFKIEINQDIRYSEDTLRLEYIPFYLVNKQNVIQGSLEVEDYLSVLEKSYNEWKEKGEGSLSSGGDSISGQACSIDGVCS